MSYPGRLHVSSDGNILQETGHCGNQHPDPTAVKVQKVKHAIKRASIETHNNPQVIVAEAVATASEPTAARLPVTRSLKRTIRRKRQKELPGLKLPRNLEELVVPETLKLTSKGE